MVVAFRPEVITVGHAYQLRGYPGPVAGLAHAPFQHIIHIELGADLPDITLPAAEKERRGSRCYSQFGQLGKGVNDFLVSEHFPDYGTGTRCFNSSSQFKTIVIFGCVVAASVSSISVAPLAAPIGFIMKKRLPSG